MCAVFVSSFPSFTAFVFARLRSSSLVSVRRPLAAGACRFPLLAMLVRSSRPSSRRLVSWGVSWLFFAVRSSARLVFPINSLGGPLRCLVRRSSFPSCSSFFGVSPCPAHRSPSRFSSRPLVSSSSPYSLVSPGVSSWLLVVSGSVLSSRSLRFMAMAAATRLSHLVAACSRPRCLPSWNPIGRWRRRKWTRRLCQLDFSIRQGRWR